MSRRRKIRLCLKSRVFTERKQSRRCRREAKRKRKRAQKTRCQLFSLFAIHFFIAQALNRTFLFLIAKDTSNQFEIKNFYSSLTTSTIIESTSDRLEWNLLILHTAADGRPREKNYFNGDRRRTHSTHFPIKALFSSSSCTSDTMLLIIGKASSPDSLNRVAKSACEMQSRHLIRYWEWELFTFFRHSITIIALHK